MDHDLILVYCRLFGNSTDAEDGALRRVDDRREGVDLQRTEVGNGEGGAL